jgi:signal transduction histidine kinase
MISVLLLDEKPNRRTELVQLLNNSGHFRVTIPPSLEFAIEKCQRGSADALIVLQDEPGPAVLTSLWSSNTDVPVILASSGTFNPRLAEESRAHHARYVNLEEPVESSFPALEQVTKMAVDLHRAEQRVAFLKKKLELVGSVTRHDVLNQLTVVMGYNELLLMMIEDPTMKSYLERTQGAINRIRSQFQFAKEYQNLGIEPPHFQMIRSVVHQAGEKFDLKGIRVVETCGNAAVCADLLFENAIACLFEHTLSHSANVTEIRVFLEGDRSGRTTLVFADNGTGELSTNKERIFEYGHDKTASGGLFFAREILALTGITITYTGESGKGARFEMQIPEERFQNEGKPSSA